MLEVSGPLPDGELYEVSGTEAYDTLTVGAAAGEAGTVTVRTGARLETVDALLGHAATASGAVTVDGPGAVWVNTNTLEIGDLGAGAVVVSGGGRLESKTATVGGLAGTGSLTVTGAGSSWVNDDAGVNLGRDGRTGRLTVADGASATITGTGLYIGAGGRLEISGPGTTFTIGTPGIGDPELGPWLSTDGGDVVVSGGATVDTTGGYIGASTNATPSTMTVTGAGTTWSTHAWLYVGGQNGGEGDGVGTLTISDGAQVTGRSVGFGMDHYSTGTLVLTGPGSSLSAFVSNTKGGNIYVGYAGTATATVSDGALMHAQNEIRVAYGHVDSTATLAIGALADQAAAAAGTLEATALVFGDGDGTLLFNHTSQAYDFDVVLKGTGTIRQLAGGTILSADSPDFAGAVDVAGGALRIDGMLAGGDVTVHAGALLDGVGTAGDVTVLAGGVHAPGHSIGTQTVAGDYSNAGTLEIEVGPNGADRLVVTGTVTLDGTRLLVAPWPSPALSGAVVGTPFTIIENDGVDPVTGGFAAFDGLAFLDADVDTAGGTGNDVVLTLERNGRAFADAARTENEAAAAAALDGLSTASPLWNAIAFAPTDAAASAAFGALAGEIHASLLTGLVEDSRFVRAATGRHLRAASGAGISAWAEGYGAWGTIDGTAEVSGLDHRTGGVLVGADMPLSDTMRLGIVAGYGRSEVDLQDRAERATADTYSIGLYGGGQWGALGLRLGLDYAWHDVSTRREVDVPGVSDRLTADYGGRTIQVYGEVGYTIALDAARLEPFVGLAYVNVDTDRYDERGGDAALAGSGDADDVGLTTVGLRAATDLRLGAAAIRADGMVGWRHAIGDDPTATHAFDGSDDFTVTGTPLARDAAVVEAGLSVGIGADLTLGVSYTGQFGDGLQEQGVRADLTWRF